jgi:hypothetical protein
VLTLFLLFVHLCTCDPIQILDLYAQKLKLAPTVDLGSIARSTAGMTGADLAHLLNSSALRASALDKPAITNEDIEYTKDALAFWHCACRRWSRWLMHLCGICRCSSVAAFAVFVSPSLRLCLVQTNC